MFNTDDVYVTLNILNITVTNLKIYPNHELVQNSLKLSYGSQKEKYSYQMFPLTYRNIRNIGRLCLTFVLCNFTTYAVIFFRKS